MYKIVERSFTWFIQKYFTNIPNRNFKYFLEVISCMFFNHISLSLILVQIKKQQATLLVIFFPPQFFQSDQMVFQHEKYVQQHLGFAYNQTCN